VLGLTGVKDKDSFPVIVVANKIDMEYERQVGAHGKRALETVDLVGPRGRSLNFGSLSLTWSACRGTRVGCPHWVPVHRDLGQEPHQR